MNNSMFSSRFASDGQQAQVCWKCNSWEDGESSGGVPCLEPHQLSWQPRRGERKWRELVKAM